jgi:hypothetical protein
MKFLVFTYHDEMLHGTKSYKDVAELTMPSKIDFCKTHGYDFYAKDNDFDFTRRVNWERVPMFIDFIKKWYGFIPISFKYLTHNYPASSTTHGPSGPPGSEDFPLFSVIG